MKERTSITMDPARLNDLDRHADSRGRSRSNLIERIVCEWLDGQEGEPLAVGTRFEWHGPTGWTEFEVMADQVHLGEPRRQLYRWRLRGGDWPAQAVLSERASMLRAWKELGEQQGREST